MCTDNRGIKLEWHTLAKYTSSNLFPVSGEWSNSLHKSHNYLSNSHLSTKECSFCLLCSISADPKDCTVCQREGWLTIF